MIPVATNPKMLTFPDVAAKAGVSVDKLRKLKRKLADAGLAVKVGGIWLVLEANAAAAAQMVGASKRRGE